MTAPSTAPRSRPVGPGRARSGMARLAGAGLLASMLGCAHVGAPAPDAALPPAAPARAVPDFSAGLRCMDTLLLEHGVQGLTVSVEDPAEPAPRSGAIPRDLLIASVADMTPRSRAIRVYAAGRAPADTRYALRGSVSRVEDRALGAVTEGLRLELAVFDARDGSAQPGTATRNTVGLAPAGQGQRRWELHKAGERFALPGGPDDGRAGALRALADLAGIETFGKLARVPYWSCLGLPASEAGVAGEIQDWYDAMAARPAELIGWFQQQLRLRGVYDGPVDGRVNPPLKEAVARYREALGLSREARLSLDFYKAYLGADHAQAVARLAAPPAAPGHGDAASAGGAGVATAPSPPPSPAGAPVPAPAALPLTLSIEAHDESQRFARGQAVQLVVRPSREAHVYCYYLDERRKVMRFFPNRFRQDSRIVPDGGLQLPGSMPFEMVMNRRGVSETVTCFATERDVLPQVSAGLGGSSDFAPLPVSSLEQVRLQFLKAGAGEMAQDTFHLRAR